MLLVLVLLLRFRIRQSYASGDCWFTLTATAASGWTFAGWSGAVTGSVNPVSVTMDADKSVTATFTQDQYALTVNVVWLLVLLLRFRIRQLMLLVTVVTLTATAASGWTFAGWSGAVTGSTNPASVTMDAAKSVTATFTQDEYALTVTVAPSSGAGSVSADKAAPYHLGDVVTLTPTASSGYTFFGWSGDGVAGVGNTWVGYDGWCEVCYCYFHSDRVYFDGYSCG